MKNKFRSFILVVAVSAISSTCFSGNNDDLTKACMKGDLEGAKKAIAAGADVNGKDAVGWKPLGTAIFWPEITQLLLDNKAVADDPSSGALVNAAGLGSYEVLKLLLNAGADPNKPFSGSMALESTVGRSLCKECVQILIEKGAATNTLNLASGNLLDVFAGSALPASDWIENNKVQAGGWEKMGFTLPDWYKNPDVTKLGTPDEIIKLLVNAGVDINAENKHKDTPLLTALQKKGAKSPEVILAFINNGSNVNVEGYAYKGHALLQAAGLGYVEVLDAMFAKGADMNREFKVNDTESGQTLKGINPLMWAARSGNLDAVKYLVQKGAKLDEGAFGTSFNIKTQCLTKVENKSALHYAVDGENLEVVKYLVENTQASWKSPIKIDKLKKTSTMGPATVTSCYDSGEYSASQYANSGNQASIASYLKSKKL